MQGIQFFEYKFLLEGLSRSQQSEVYELPLEQEEAIKAQETKLRELYNSYRHAWDAVSLIVKEFELHRAVVKRTIIHYRKLEEYGKKRKSAPSKIKYIK